VPGDRVVDEVAVEELTMNEAMLLTYSGRPREALAVVASSGRSSTRRTRGTSARGGSGVDRDRTM
jgi:hypothetical protein